MTLTVLNIAGIGGISSGPDRTEDNFSILDPNSQANPLETAAFMNQL